jgi:hypothetical protein
VLNILVLSGSAAFTFTFPFHPLPLPCPVPLRLPRRRRLGLCSLGPLFPLLPLSSEVHSSPCYCNPSGISLPAPPPRDGRVAAVGGAARFLVHVIFDLFRRCSPGVGVRLPASKIQAAVRCSGPWSPPPVWRSPYVFVRASCCVEDPSHRPLFRPLVTVAGFRTFPCLCTLISSSLCYYRRVCACIAHWSAPLFTSSLLLEADAAVK